MAYSNKIEKIGAGIAKAELYLVSAHAADAAIANPAIVEEDGEYNRSVVRGYWEVDDMPKTNDRAMLAEYKLDKLCEGLSELIRVVEVDFLIPSVKEQAGKLFNAYLDSYPMVAHEFIHLYMRSAPQPSDQLKDFDDLALMKENNLVDKGYPLTRLLEKEAGSLPMERIMRRVSESVSGILYRDNIVE